MNRLFIIKIVLSCFLTSSLAACGDCVSSVYGYDGQISVSRDSKQEYEKLTEEQIDEIRARLNSAKSEEDVVALAADFLVWKQKNQRDELTPQDARDAIESTPNLLVAIKGLFGYVLVGDPFEACQKFIDARRQAGGKTPDEEAFSRDKSIYKPLTDAEIAERVLDADDEELWFLARTKVVNYLLDGGVKGTDEELEAYLTEDPSGRQAVVDLYSKYAAENDKYIEEIADVVAERVKEEGALEDEEEGEYEDVDLDDLFDDSESGEGEEKTDAVEIEIGDAGEEVDPDYLIDDPENDGEGDKTETIEIEIGDGGEEIDPDYLIDDSENDEEGDGAKTVEIEYGGGVEEVDPDYLIDDSENDEEGDNAEAVEDENRLDDEEEEGDLTLLLYAALGAILALPVLLGIFWAVASRSGRA